MAVSVSGEKPRLVVICGPTASGKTALALELAQRFPIEVISADSRQVYREMDIGTAKPTAAERESVPHHLIDVVDPDEEFTAANFVEQGRRLVFDILSRAKLPFVVGGTGLYIRSLTEGLLDAPGGNEAVRSELWELEKKEGEGALHRLLQQKDPVLAARVHPRNTVRIIRALEVLALTGQPLSQLQSLHAFSDRPFETLKIGLNPDRDELCRRIDSRVEIMLESGLLDEVKGVLERGYSPQLKSLQTIGYRECIRHLEGELSLEEAVSLIQRETRRYAKRQLTWFRRDNSTIWVDYLRESARIHSLIDHFYVP